MLSALLQQDFGIMITKTRLLLLFFTFYLSILHFFLAFSFLSSFLFFFFAESTNTEMLAMKLKEFSVKKSTLVKELKGLREGHTTNNSITKLALNFIEIVQKAKSQCDFIEHAIKVSREVKSVFVQLEKLEADFATIATQLELKDKQKQVSFATYQGYIIFTSLSAADLITFSLRFF